jgi:tetratricopeptide (TPR) repeat protein
MKTSGCPLRVMVLLILLCAGSTEAGLLLEARGAVRLQRQQWRDFYPVREGVQLSRGDLLHLAADARAAILCADFATIWTPLSGELSGATQGCPPAPGAPLFRHGQRASLSRSETAPYLPYIIVPRHTAISGPHPPLRWNAVPGTQQYSIKVIDASRPRHPVWGPITVGAAAIRYPDDAPALQSGTTYLVQVATDNGARSPTIGVGFRLVSEEKQRQIADQREELRRKIRQGMTQQLALAVYSLHQQLHSEALVQLDALVQQSESAQVHLLRAHVLLETQLLQAAAQQYEQARHLAAHQHDPESQAEALVGLARLADDRAVMVQYYQEAIALYHELGERERAEKLTEEMRSVP